MTKLNIHVMPIVEKNVIERRQVSFKYESSTPIQLELGRRGKAKQTCL